MPSRRETLMAVLDAHTEQNIDKIMAHHSDDFTWGVLPKSLGQAPLDNTAYRHMYETTAPAFRNYQMTVVDIFEDEKTNKAVVWIDATAETDVGPYANEKMLLFYFDDAGKISKTYEFLDSAATAAFFAKMQPTTAEKGGN